MFFLSQFNFVMQKVKTDTTVVPQGVVAAMKALREKEGNTEGKTIKILCSKNICFIKMK